MSGETILTSKPSDGILEVLKYPDPRLKKISEPVTVFDDDLAEFVKILFSSMRVHDGVGLAAPQVGVLKKVAVIEYDGKSYVLINPKVTDQKGIQEGEEGCLSFPGIYAHVTRPKWVKIETQDLNGETHTIEGEDYAGTFDEALLWDRAVCMTILTICCCSGDSNLKSVSSSCSNWVRAEASLV